MSGSPKNPTWNPTKTTQEPDNQPPGWAENARRLSTILTLLSIPRASIWVRVTFDSGVGICSDSWGAVRVTVRWNNGETQDIFALVAGAW
jgi:hypothetical protein